MVDERVLEDAQHTTLALPLFTSEIYCLDFGKVMIWKSLWQQLKYCRQQSRVW